MTQSGSVRHFRHVLIGNLLEFKPSTPLHPFNRTPWMDRYRMRSPESDRGDDGRGLDRPRLGLVGNQLAQERNEYDERDSDCEAPDAKFCEQFRVTWIGGDRCGAGRVRDHSRKVTCEQ